MSDGTKNALARLGHGAKLNRLGFVAACSLVTEPTFADAARKAGIAVSTLARWLQRDDFQQLLERVRAELEEVARQKLVNDERQNAVKLVQILQLLPDVRERRGTYVATCPACSAKGSLHFWRTELGGVVMNCRKSRCPQLKIQSVLFPEENE